MLIVRRGGIELLGHRFDPKHVERLDNPERRKMLPPDDILAHLAIESTSVVADIGCGPGYFTIPAARMTEATVYGVDVSTEMLRILDERTTQQGLTNISTLESKAEHVALPDHSVDRLICSLVLHEVDDLLQTLKEFKRILHPNGKVLFLEWEKKSMEVGPPLHERIEAEELLRLVKLAGFRCEASSPNPFQYMLTGDCVSAK